MKPEIHRYAKLSLFSSALMVLLIAFHEHLTRGPQVLILGILAVMGLGALLAWFRSTRGRVALSSYALLNIFALLKFGLADGLGRHALKMLLVALHNGYLPPVLAKLFPPVGSSAVEVTGVLVFVAGGSAAHHLHRLLLAARTPSGEHHLVS